MLKTFICKKCGVEFQKEMKSSYVWYCEDCRKKRNVEINMAVKKRKIPTTEIGVGSGNSSKNKGHYTHGSFKTGIQAYRNIYKDAHIIPRKGDKMCCEICGSDKFTCIHHKDHNRENNSIENLQCLCKKCHQKHHIKRNKKGQFTAN